MITKLKSKGFFLSSTLALGVAAGIGIATAPAQAQMLGALDWSDGTSNFFDDVNPGMGDDFSVTFVSPSFPEDLTTVNGASGLFSPFFGPFPDTVDLTTTPIGIFDYVSNPTATTFLYALRNDLVFNFDSDDDGATDVSVTYGAGSTFLGDFDSDNGTILGVGFEEDSVDGEIVDINGKTFELGADNNITGVELVFNDIPETTVGGGYAAQVSVEMPHNDIPEPATILGLLAVGGLGLGLKRKK